MNSYVLDSVVDPRIYFSLNSINKREKVSVSCQLTDIVYLYLKGFFFNWFGFGIFFRCLVDPMRRKAPDDISRPLSYSFIHTGHGDPYGKTWGSPSAIDEVYLRNPMDPPDVIGLQTSVNSSLNESPLQQQTFNVMSSSPNTLPRQLSQNQVIKTSPINRTSSLSSPTSQNRSLMLDKRKGIC